MKFIPVNYKWEFWQTDIFRYWLCDEINEHYILFLMIQNEQAHSLVPPHLPGAASDMVRILIMSVSLLACLYSAQPETR